MQATILHDARPTVAPAPVFFVAYGLHYVWATRGNKLLRIDPTTNRVDKRLKIGTPTGLAAGGGSVWVTTSSNLLRIDPARVKEITHPSFAFARAPVYTHGSLWLITDFKILRIDPITLEQRDEESTGRGTQPASLAAADGALWAVDFFDGKLTRLIPGKGRTGSVRVGENLEAGRLPSSNNLSAVAVGGGATWVTVSAGH